MPNWKIVVAGVTVTIAGVFGMIAIAYANTPVPDKNDAQAEALAQGSTIYYADGKTPIAHLGTKRVIVDITKISPTLQDAVIAIENDTFREDAGISIPAHVPVGVDDRHRPAAPGRLDDHPADGP